MDAGSDREVGIACKDGTRFRARVAPNKFDCGPDNTAKVLLSLTRGAFNVHQYGREDRQPQDWHAGRKDSKGSAKRRVRHPDTCRISPPTFGETPSRDLG